jgi:hypothetical protein
MTIDELFALPLDTVVRLSYPDADPVDGVIVAMDVDEVLIRWTDTEDVYSVDRSDGESDEMLAWLSVVELPADVPVVVTDMGTGD